MSKSFPPSYSGLQFNRLPKLALNTVLPRPLGYDIRDVKTDYYVFLSQHVNWGHCQWEGVCCWITWSTSTEKSEPSPRPQYIRPGVFDAHYLDTIVRSIEFTAITCDLYLRQSERNGFWQNSTMAFHPLVVGNIPDNEDYNDMVGYDQDRYQGYLLWLGVSTPWNLLLTFVSVRRFPK